MNSFHIRTVEAYKKHDEVLEWMSKEVKNNPNINAVSLAANCTCCLNLWESERKIPAAILMIAEDVVGEK